MCVSDFQVDASKVLRLPRRSAESRHTSSCNCNAKWFSKVTLPWHEICNPSTDVVSDASNIDITKHEILAYTTRKGLFPTFFKASTPANGFATLTNSCTCHVFCNVSESLYVPHEKHFEPPKMPRDRQFLTILTSKSLWRHSVVKFCRAQLPRVLRTHGVLRILTSKSPWRRSVLQILRTPTSKSAPDLPVFNNFDFQIAVAPQRGANFGAIFGSRSSATPVFRSCLCEPSKLQNYGKTQPFAQFLPAKISHVAHLCCKTSMLQDLAATFNIVGS